MTQFSKKVSTKKWEQKSFRVSGLQIKSPPHFEIDVFKSKVTNLHCHVVAMAWSMEEGAVGREDLRLVEAWIGDRHRRRKGDW